ncbi:helix-turn-helix domain-containing protein [Streptomyces kanamyceticus]|uniref:XRE family transcriptional regulator n=1 Tax=Streptomyces kanamyceticus TaxID=1967 RepID=A0A5J6G6K6_STRKN|nr:helix-turn-helix domain-containing protein [Streptomyces kanamyceticus]QEU91370.1 XRE family transcriptional regulator [Streptomyces kanamyceticus]
MTRRGNSQRRQRFGANLAGWRVRAGLTQRQLAQIMFALSGRRWQVCRFKIALWERGARIPHEWLAIYAQALKVPFEQFARTAQVLDAPLGGVVQEDRAGPQGRRHRPAARSQDSQGRRHGRLPQKGTGGLPVV